MHSSLASYLRPLQIGLQRLRLRKGGEGSSSLDEEPLYTAISAVRGDPLAERLGTGESSVR